MKTIKLGFLGLGNIGGGVVRVIKMNGDHIEKQNGVRFELVRALVLDVNCVRTDLDMPDTFWTEDVSQIVEADDIDMIVEAMGGEEPAASFIERALKAGKTVVSANKAAIAPAWKRLDRAARESGA
ncbi:MAG: homoserine dehydrogenase, partial [Clostridia bacterium]|nr:homoserine dehydrogenase [Clostridia bacterium]